MNAAQLGSSKRAVDNHLSDNGEDEVGYEWDDHPGVVLHAPTLWPSTSASSRSTPGPDTSAHERDDPDPVLLSGWGTGYSVFGSQRSRAARGLPRGNGGWSKRLQESDLEVCSCEKCAVEVAASWTFE